MKATILYFKHQVTYLTFLVGVFVIPLALYLEFSPYKAPRLPLVVLAGMVLSQYAFHREKDFRKANEDKITSILKKELSRVPSRSEVIQRTTKVLQFRGITIILCGLIIFGLMLAYQEF